MGNSARRRALAAALAIATTATALAAPVAAHAAPGTARRCSAGLIALTFDDGPASDQTPRLLGILARLHVPATFFMIGSRVQGAPKYARQVRDAGFAIGNHTWSHPQLTHLSDAAIRAELADTQRVLRKSGIDPPHLMRPPYGDVDDRVRGVVHRMGLVPVLWDIDSRDWAGGGPTEIASRILGDLRRHESNIVLQHDGVQNSPASVGAVPHLVREARARGFCFTDLDRSGQMRTPVPKLRASHLAPGREQGPRAAVVTLKLNRPTSRKVSVRIRTEHLTATPNVDYIPVRERVVFAVGQTERTVRIRVRDDARYEPEEKFAVLLDRPRGLRLKRARYVVAIKSNDPAPKPPPEESARRNAVRAAVPSGEAAVTPAPATGPDADLLEFLAGRLPLRS